MLEIRDNASRAKIIVIALVANILIDMIDAVSLVWQYQLLIGVKDQPEAIDMSAINTSDDLQTTLGYVHIGFSLLTIICFILWFRRAYYNVHQLPGSSPSYTEGWAAGAWFVPIMNLFRPFQIMKEIWYETQRVITHRLPGHQPATLVGIWWAVWVIDSLFTNISTRIMLRADGVHDLITSTQLQLIGIGLSIPAAILAIMVVRKMHEMEKELYAEALQPNDSVFSLMPAGGTSPAVEEA